MLVAAVGHAAPEIRGVQVVVEGDGLGEIVNGLTELMHREENPAAFYVEAALVWGDFDLVPQVSHAFFQGLQGHFTGRFLRLAAFLFQAGNKG
ncbi:MAG: hypothetical protein HN719_08250 [Alphaproteobacteria bacterium]|nr:hypothetical protein [Alphaproteobacteria bacterium]